MSWPPVLTNMFDFFSFANLNMFVTSQHHAMIYTFVVWLTLPGVCIPVNWCPQTA